jgi:hypothetical protein
MPPNKDGCYRRPGRTAGELGVDTLGEAWIKREHGVFGRLDLEQALQLGEPV